MSLTKEQQKLIKEANRIYTTLIEQGVIKVAPAETAVPVEQEIVDRVIDLIHFADESGFTRKPAREQMAHIRDEVVGRLMDTYSVSVAASLIVAVVNLLPTKQ